jgi:Cu/Ag efflux pump CusA
MHSEKLETRLPRFSLSRRITVLVMLVTIVVLGTVATIGIPLELVPSGLEHPSLGVVVPWRDAPAQETLDKVIRPLEEELRGHRFGHRLSYGPFMALGVAAGLFVAGGLPG